MNMFKKDIILRWIGDNIFNMDKKEFIKLCKYSQLKEITIKEIQIGDVIYWDEATICISFNKSLEEATLYAINKNQAWRKSYDYNLLTNPAIYEHRYYKRILKKLKLKILKEKLIN